MSADDDNRILDLCDEGLTAELAGNLVEAKIIFRQAWDSAEGPFERCVTAHYLARHQDSDTESLEWNLRALSIADEVDDIDQIADYLPAMYLNAAVGLVRAGEYDRARDLYLLAADSIERPEVGVSPEWLFIRRGLEAAGFVPQGDSLELRQLIARLHETQNSDVLAAILPTYVTNTGTDEDVAHLTDALTGVWMARLLDDEEQALLRQAIDAAAGLTATPTIPVAQMASVTSSSSTGTTTVTTNHVEARLEPSGVPAAASSDDNETDPNVGLRL